ncbi:DNA helicase [Gracilaria domingensis]|nr:DNA helicase [Gracilaria domingensis]
MGLSKTIQTIALLAWLAVEKEIWGPHLIVFPTSVMVKWEVEFKKWLPGFKVLTYFGSVKERMEQRRGWTRPDMLHVCITSYTLAVQESLILRRKKWYYLILDEAHNIKNFESQRWQTLLTFSSRHRLLLTGAPLQNSVMELWSLMHFLMPKLFASHSWFKDTFWKPLIEAVEAERESNRGRSETVSTLHGVLRPFLLRRLKADVEKGLPPKTEHVISFRLSKRQRQLYEDCMARNDTRETLQSGDFFGVMNVLMQLRKVCNHPDLFEGRPILSPFSCAAVFYPIPTIVARAIREDVRHNVTLRLLGLDFQYGESNSAGRWYEDEIARISAVKQMRSDLKDEATADSLGGNLDFIPSGPGGQRALSRKAAFRRAALHHQVLIHALRIRQRAILGQDLRKVFTMTTSSLSRQISANSRTESVADKPRVCMVRSVEEFIGRANPIAHRFFCCVTRAIAPCVALRYYGDDMLRMRERDQYRRLARKSSGFRALFREFEVRSQITIPDIRLIQWDCGKLQTLERLIRELKVRKSRVLIFTQMTRMLDILESFRNLHCSRYLRFNADTRIFCMILTTSAGGVGLNLTGADTVIFYDSDYNPAIDNQAQDRAHRIGQTKPVHVYRLISEQTVEESILKRAMEKRTLEQHVISQAGFTTDAIQGARGLLKTGTVGCGSTVGEGFTLSRNAEKSDTVKNGFRSSSETSDEKKQHRTPENWRNGSSSEKVGKLSTMVDIQSSCGLFMGFRFGNGIETVSHQGKLEGDSTECGRDRDMNEDQTIASKLLASEDEREEMDLQVAEKEKRDLEAEFKGTPIANQGRLSKRTDVRPNDSEDLNKLLDTLTPIQRYALRVLERLNSAKPFTHVDCYVGTPPVTSSQESESVLESFPSREYKRKSDSECSGEDDTQSLLYEIDVTDEGQTSYLKAPTDADADIKLYLPLRDGGPEELKFSTVVLGTAVAGLECAEDAAFFPHAYNRMSRRMHATRRQKEKGLENLRKRKAEIEVKRKHEVSSSVSNQGSSPKVYSADTCREEARRSSNLERVKTSKGKCDMSRYPPPNVHSKKTRVDPGPKSGANVAVTSSVTGPESHAGMGGLLRIKPKKNVRKFTIPGMKSSIAFYGGNMWNEHQGVNDE